MRTQTIINEINNNFAETYKNAKYFVNSGELWDFCIETIRNPKTMEQILFANKLGIPPVRSLLLIFELEKEPERSFEFTAQQSQWMGCLMGYVFKSVLNYQEQKMRCKVEQYGVKTATRYLNGPYIKFEE